MVWEYKDWKSIPIKNTTYFYNKFIKEWIKEENILFFNNDWKWVNSVVQINDILKKYKWNIEDIVYFGHANKSSVSDIDEDNVSDLINLNDKNINMTLVACNSWKWDNSIAQQISNSIWITVIAPNAYVSVSFIEWINQKTAYPWMFDPNKKAYEPSFANFWNTKYFIDPSPIFEAEWKTFYPTNL